MRYIGSKRNLLPQIEQMLGRHTDGSKRTFVDLFAGTNVVATHFAAKYHVVTNDISYALAKGTLGISEPPAFDRLHTTGINDPLTWLSTTGTSDSATTAGYATREYSPAGEAGRTDRPQ